MRRIGRNEKCPCGSGKKLKKCHLGRESELSINMSKTKVSTFKELVEDYRAAPILTFLSYLQIMPENHGHNFSIEMMARDVIEGTSENDERPFMTWSKILEAVGRGQSFGREDPINLFTENTISVQGNAIVFPGVYRNGSVILNEFLLVILSGENSLPDDFKRLVYSSAGLLLYMSNQIADDFGYYRYMDGELSAKIVFPEHKEFIKEIGNFKFSKEHLEKIAGLYDYDVTVLDHFFISVNDPKLKEVNPDENIVSYKPLIWEGDDVLVYMPTNIVCSLINFIHEQSITKNCSEALMKMVVYEQNHRAGMALDHLGWSFTDIKLPVNSSGLPVSEAIWQFDNQKFGYLSFIDVEKMEAEYEAEKFGQLLLARNAQVVGHLKSLEGAENFEVLSLIVLSETGHGSFFNIPKTKESELRLILTISELNTIAYDTESDFLTLWKFATIYNDTALRYQIINLSGILNLYAVYRKNDGSLLNSDEGYPDGVMLTYLPGGDVDLRQEVKIARDEHAAEIIVPTGEYGFVTVIKERKFAPIYTLKDRLSPEYRRALQCYRMPIWVTNYQKDANILAAEIGEALVFWLYRLEGHLSEELNKQFFVQFEIELIIDDQMSNGHEYIVKTLEPSSVVLTTTIVHRKLQIEIPYEFIYLMARADNLGEKMLAEAAVNGIINYIRSAGKEIALTANDVKRMVEAELQPENAKMILFCDAAANVELDSRHLPREHYITDVDTSYVLDNLVSYLPKNMAIPEKIGEVHEKISLCDAIVGGIINELSHRIAEFDCEQLLEWLIKWNERCVFTREIREIRSPAKIACFTDFEEEVNEINDKDGKLVPTAHSLRTLIEFVAATLPKGNKWPNYADIGVMLALTNQLTTWGSMSEAMRMGLVDPEMGLLPSGRIGSDKSFQNDVLVPYAYARNRGIVSKYIERFEDKYVQKYNSDTIPTEEVQILNAAFEDEFGVTLTEVSEVVGALINYGFSREESCSDISEFELFNLLKSEIPERDEERLFKTVEMMTLLQRKSIGAYPKGFSSKDIFPWRYGRNLSYLRRPIAKVPNREGSSNYLFGFRHMKTFADNLIFLIFTGKLPETDSEKMGSFIGGVLHGKGTPYRNEVSEWLHTNTDLEVISHEVTIEEGGHIPADKNYGDVDVMAIDHKEKIIYSLECKNLVGARNIHEMKVEIDIYLGREGQEAKAKINKHVQRDIYLKANPELLKKFLKIECDDYSVVSMIVASDEMPLAYLAKAKLPLQLISFSQVKEKGKTDLYK